MGICYKNSIIVQFSGNVVFVLYGKSGYVLVSNDFQQQQSTKSIRHHSYMLFGTLASIVVVAIDCELLECEWVVLLFVFLDGKFVPAPQSLDMN